MNYEIIFSLALIFSPAFLFVSIIKLNEIIKEDKREEEKRIENRRLMSDILSKKVQELLEEKKKVAHIKNDLTEEALNFSKVKMVGEEVSEPSILKNNNKPKLQLIIGGK